jgi:amidase
MPRVAEAGGYNQPELEPRTGNWKLEAENWSIHMRGVLLRVLFLVVMLSIAATEVLLAQSKPILAQTYHNTFSRSNPVLARIRPGDTVTTKTIDASGRDDTGTVRARPPNPLTGPFYVEGAEPGDALVVHFTKVRMNRNWGFSAYRLGLYSLTPESIEGIYPNRYRPGEIIKERVNVVRWELDLDRRMVRLKEPASAVQSMEFPGRPMLGCVGVAPAGDFAPTSSPAGSYGGNLDYNEIGEGTTVILPVYQPGALLSIGDGHALQGDGEPIGTGIETSMDVEFSVQLRKNANLAGPRAETSEHIISIGSQPEFVSTTNRGLQMATSDMVNWLTADYKLEPWAAHLLIGTQARYDIVTVAGTVALKISKKVLPAQQVR